MSALSVAAVVALFEQWGSEAYDEEVAQLEHALQTAAHAAAAGASDAMVAAALLHDVGHLLDLEAGRAADRRDLRHEDTGAAWLRPRFPTTVTAPIALHVRAKRYLCALDLTYVRALSAGSLASLERQGGPMSATEAAAFARLAGADDAIQLRRWDDAGKVDGRRVPPLDSYADLLQRVTIG